MFRPLAPGTYNVTAVMAGYYNTTVTVFLPADGSGETVELFMGRAGLDALTNWGLARKFGPLREGTPGPVRSTPATATSYLNVLQCSRSETDSLTCSGMTARLHWLLCGRRTLTGFLAALDNTAGGCGSSIHPTRLDLCIVFFVFSFFFRDKSHAPVLHRDLCSRDADA